MSLAARFGRLFSPPPEKLAARRLFRSLMSEARAPAFYLEGGVADTLDGRFDLVVLHLYLVLRRLKGEGPAGKAMAQRLFDAAFQDFDEALREMGVGDLSVGKKIRKMAEAFYGRLAAYEQALGSNAPEALSQALVRNVYRGADPGADKLAWLLAAVRRFEAAVAAAPLDRLLAGEFEGPARGRAA